MTENYQFISSAISDRGLSEKRPQNEDSFVELKDHGFFAVADGVGGAQAGDVASQMAIEILSEAFVHRSPDSDPEETMKIAIERANTAIFQMSRDLPQLSSMATTVVALHTAGDVITFGHVGDSRLYRVDSSGQIFRETQDHSVVEEEVRAGRMTPEQAETHPSRNVISRALGAEETVNVDLKMQIMHPGNTFLLCTDGITRHIEDWELAALLGSGQEPVGICAQMKEICYSRGAEDNLTAVIIRFPSQAAPAAYMDEAIHDIEPERVTVAAARPEPVQQEEIQEITDETEEAEENADQTFLLEKNTSDMDKHDVETREPYTSSSVLVQAQNTPTKVDRPVLSSFSDPQPERSSIGKVLSALALLLVGAALGFGSHYFMTQSAQPQPVQTQPTPQIVSKSNNVPLTAFEEGRRIVDKDPAAYINSKAASAQNADDYFLLGRAFLLTGKGWEAKRSFNEAKNRLAQADAANAKTMAAEIAMALTIIETPGAADAFTKELSSSNTGVILNANSSPISNVNSDSNFNANQTVR
ncbi:MAG: protein phosphatase 2C domain-containing protein [Pyrinomonadaceae bacterium]